MSGKGLFRVQRQGPRVTAVTMTFFSIAPHAKRK
jgi:hypothetical protein